MQEQRLTQRLLKYWNMIRKNKPIPDIRQFNPTVIEDVWSQCFMVGINGGANITYKYEYMGADVTEIYGHDMTDEYVDHRVKQFPGVIILKKLSEIMSGHQPQEDGGCFINESGKAIKYRACFLPFGNDNNLITHIVVGLSCRAA